MRKQIFLALALVVLFSLSLTVLDESVVAPANRPVLASDRSARGWLIDQVLAIGEAQEPPAEDTIVFLPLVIKEVDEGQEEEGAENPSLSGSACPASIHDAYVVAGPDGKMYPTWHPRVDPKSGCYFTHEHGDDPTKSLANSTLPAFGYIGELAGMHEPHEGFKVFVTNAGFRNEEGRVALDSSRVVAHMGTGGTGRYTERHHSLQVDLIGRGREFHVQQMADTGLPGSLCNRAGRDFVTLGCRVSSLYEIWKFQVRIGGKLSGSVATAVFDPILVRDPQDNNRKVYTADIYGRQFFGGKYNGCIRESYHGPFIWSNANSPTTFYTDAHGQLTPNGPVKQIVSAHSFKNYYASTDGNTQFKRKASQCGSGLGLVN